MESAPTLFLTFDDGPSPATPEILDILKQHLVSATFFMCGENILRHPDIAKRVYAEGHAIGNHAYSHSLIKTLTGYGMPEEIRKTHAVIENTLGLSPGLFRAPWGIMHPLTRHGMRALRYTPYGWYASAMDWMQPFIPYTFMKNRFLYRLKPNAILLLHDGQATYPDPYRAKTIRLVSELIPFAKQKGYCFSALPIPDP